MRIGTLRRSVVTALAVAVAAGSLAPAFAHHKAKHPKPKPKPKTAREIVEYGPTCVGDPNAVQRLEMTVKGTPTWGLIAMPAKPPKGVVVFGHGYGHTAESWRRHIARTAARHQVVAVAMNYRFQQDFPGSPLPSSRGWRVAEGAEDSIAVAQLVDRACPTAKTFVMYGISMGFNTAGLAVAAQAKRKNGAPLFDYLFDIEGAANVTETYFEARALALTGNAYARNAVADIEQEMGGTFEERRDVYLERTVVNRAEDIAASGIKGVVMVHGVADGLVGYNQAPEMYTALRRYGVPVDFWTAGTRGSKSEAGTTLDGYATGQIPGYQSPFAGHASEASETHIVGMAGFERLAALFSGTAPACRIGVLDGNAGFTQTAPLTLPATC
ncbi:MAG TPA: hypothetical protein VNA20_14245 [Frankiaceae bacterium]|nr:hypothetical protein [Frankiaceae bacterium]